MKGIQVLMIVGILALSSCTSGFFTDKIKKLFNNNELKNEDVMGLIDAQIQNEENKQKIKLSKEYLDHFDDDTENVTNNPLMQVVVDAKTSLKKINEDLIKELREINATNELKLKEAKKLNSIFTDDEIYEAAKLSIDEEFAKKAQLAIEKSSSRTNEVFLKAYGGIFTQ